MPAFRVFIRILWLCPLSLATAVWAIDPLPDVEPTTATQSTTATTRRLDTLLNNLYPGRAPDLPPAGLPGTPVAPIITPAPTPAHVETVSTATQTRMIIRRPVVEPATSDTQTTEAPAIDLTLIGEDSPTSAAVLRALPVGVDPDATPQTPTPVPEQVIAEDRTSKSIPISSQGTSSTLKRAVLSHATRVRVNHASETELAEGLRIDARRARFIVEFRELYGPFHTPEDLDQVSGLPGDLVRKWEQAGILDFE